MDQRRLVRQSSKQQVERSDSNCSMQGNVIHGVTSRAKTAKRLIAVCDLRASGIASMNKPTPRQMPLCRF
jgi:hypothetical protein